MTSMMQNRCTKCTDVRLKTIKEINPETNDMNMRVICKCESCGHEDEYLEMSHNMERSLNRGW